jgi:hypothetical protein
MSTGSAERRPDIDRGGRPGPWAIGLSVFAGAMMMTVGLFQVLEGIAAVANDSFFVKAPNYTYEVDTTAWGWIHIVIGAIVALVGVGVLMGTTWGRVIGVIVILLSMFSNFLFLPYYPLWTLLIIGLDVAIVWALSQPSLERGHRG